jgi:transcriptional regulator with XRE-family HTH domain
MTTTVIPNGDAARTARKAADMSQESAAGAIGCTQALISYVESGRRTRAVNVKALALLYGVQDWRDLIVPDAPVLAPTLAALPRTG